MALPEAKEPPANGGTASASDEELVARADKGERRAFDELVRRHQERLYYLCLRYVKSQADAQDVVQRSFVKAYKSLSSFRGDSKFKTWLYRIAINLSLNHIRDRGRERPEEIDDAALSESAVGLKRIELSEDAARLRDAIEELPNMQRQVLQLRIYDDLTFKEVGALAGCSENSAKVNFHYAVKKLRSLLQKDSGGTP